MADKTSLKGSQPNVAESAQPLLEGGILKVCSKERIEIESCVVREGVEQEQPTEGGSKFRNLTCVDTFTINMNLLDRDTLHINDHINVAFEDVLAEPRASQSFDQTWRFGYLLFASTKYWVYRVLAAACAIPCGLTWGLLFSLLTLASVWIITPAMKIVDVLLHVVRRVWGGTVRAVLDPVFQSAGLLIMMNKDTKQAQENI